jgi:hypothetical protein
MFGECLEDRIWNFAHEEPSSLNHHYWLVVRGGRRHRLRLSRERIQIASVSIRCCLGLSSAAPCDPVGRVYSQRAQLGAMAARYLDCVPRNLKRFSLFFWSSNAWVAIVRDCVFSFSVTSLSILLDSRHTL